MGCRSYSAEIRSTMLAVPCFAVIPMTEPTGLIAFSVAVAPPSVQNLVQALLVIIICVSKGQTLLSTIMCIDPVTTPHGVLCGRCSFYGVESRCCVRFRIEQTVLNVFCCSSWLSCQLLLSSFDRIARCLWIGFGLGWCVFRLYIGDQVSVILADLLVGCECQIRVLVFSQTRWSHLLFVVGPNPFLAF